MVNAPPLSRSRWRAARWLVIAPHPDDETLGVGALIAEAAVEGRLAGIVYLTDGTGSHPHPDASSRARLKATRRLEARQACRRLAGGERCALTFLDWPDARPVIPDSPAYRAAVRRLAGLCRREAVDAIAVTAIDEPHCDHAAAGGLAADIARAALRPVRVFDYYVWGEPAAARLAWRTGPMRGGKRRAALAAHRSQLTPLFGAGFSLPDHRRVMPDRDRLYPRTRP